MSATRSPADDLLLHPPAGCLSIRGARTHNLRNVDLDIPRGQLVVLTGPSGSGKSSLAFDTLFAEGQRQYIESLSVSARQFLSQLERPDVDEITGLAPVICIDQRVGAANPRSTVATSTEIYDYLRLLFARTGDITCPDCGVPIRQQSLEQIQDALAALPEGTKLMLLAPLVRGRKGQHAEALDAIRKAGQVRVRVNGVVYDLEAVPPLDGRKAHTIEAVVDRIILREGARARLAESLQLAIKQGAGIVVAAYQEPGERSQGAGIRSRESGEGGQAARSGHGDAEWTERLFSTLYACPNCQLSLEEIEPRTFSFNSPYGACPECEGLGYRLQFDPDQVVPDTSRSLAGGAVAPWRTPAKTRKAKAATSGRDDPKAATSRRGPRTADIGFGGHAALAAAIAFLESHSTPANTPFDDLRPAVREKLLYGDGHDFLGILKLLEQEYATATDAARKEELEAFRGHVTCPACRGDRLRPAALGVRIAGKNIAEVCRMSVAEAAAFFAALRERVQGSGFGVQEAETRGQETGVRSQESADRRQESGDRNQEPETKSQKAEDALPLSSSPPLPLFSSASLSADATILAPDLRPVAEPILNEVVARLGFLHKVGLDYLTLGRPSDTLSGGELQRVRLATGIGSGLAGICYILDEPSIGLHPRDNQRLIAALRELLGSDNTVIVVEHDEAMMREADWLIDIGPGAGSRGGQVVAEGTPAEVMANPASLTGRYLAGAAAIAVPRERRKAAKSRSLVIEGVTTNNLQRVTATFPLGLFIGVTGVSGSGKSSLVNETLVPALIRQLGGVAPKPGPYTGLRGASQIDKVIPIDQSPLGRSPRSNPATYTGAFDEIRKVFAATKEARQLGFRHSRFSFNVPGGRCEECQGQGLKRLEMGFLPDLAIPCPVCEGRRFNRQTLQVRYKGLSIADVLALPIEEAAAFFANFPAIHRVLASLTEVGLGYLQLGQSSLTLSGGESQRIKLATELARTDTGQTLYVLDEPTTGLHFDDVRLLLAVLQRLVDRGNTVIVIEHHLDVLKCCDWLIDLGPDGGARGGQIIATGTPEELAALAGNETGRFLRETLSAARPSP